MPESLHQIGAAVPFIALYSFRPINAFLEVQSAPDINERAKVERKIDLARRIVLLDGRERLKIGEKRIGIFTGDFRILRIRKCGV
jgi:hypothetical protein